MSKKIQYIMGFVLIGVLMIIGRLYFKNDMLFFRMIAGLGLGYALTRGAMGFAGSVNRAYKFGTTKLMRILMYMFSITAIVSIGFLYNGTEGYGLWINAINFGLLAGGILFGIGMSFAGCCASGVLTDIVTALPRGIITLLFFGLGVFVGFPLQKSQTWITQTWFSTSSFEGKGVYLPDLFKWDGLNGYLGAAALTVLFALIVVALSYAYENHRKKTGKFSGLQCEVDHIDFNKTTVVNENQQLLGKGAYTRMFLKPWSLEVASTVIAGIYLIMLGITKSGWGASTPYGFWFGKFLMLFGVSPETLASFTLGKVDPFIQPFFKNQINVQNVSIMLGTVIALLLAGKFTKAIKSELKITFKEALLFAVGGFLMGFGTRLANGCNVGALYTPIASFSLSGWIFLIVMVIGGVIGNKIFKTVMK